MNSCQNCGTDQVQRIVVGIGIRRVECVCRRCRYMQYDTFNTLENSRKLHMSMLIRSLEPTDFNEETFII